MGQVWQDNNTWFSDLRYNYTYEEGRLIYYTLSYWRDDSWIYGGSDTYTYDINGYLIEYISDWSVRGFPPNGVWRLINAYDTNGNLFESLCQTLEESVAIAEDNFLPEIFKLSQNYPNPFNPLTTIQYELPQRSDVQIAIYDLLGKKVTTLATVAQDAGYKSIQWDATNDEGQPVSAGMYFYQIKAGDFVQTRKMILLK